jgi:hypothetical protein
MCVSFVIAHASLSSQNFKKLYYFFQDSLNDFLRERERELNELNRIVLFLLKKVKVFNSKKLIKLLVLI